MTRIDAMLSLKCFESLPSNAQILCIGAHSDDIEIGAGGTISRLLRTRPDISVSWVVCSATDIRVSEAQKSADMLLDDADSSKVLVESFRNGYFPYIAAELKDFFESLKNLPNPDLVFTHYRHDMHQDHRVVSELTRNTFRNHLILEYEIPKYDGDLGSPNAFVPVQDEDLRKKVEALMTCFASQHDKPWFKPETFESLACLRGNECNADSGFAEGFYSRKLILG